MTYYVEHTFMQAKELLDCLLGLNNIVSIVSFSSHAFTVNFKFDWNLKRDCVYLPMPKK